LILAAAAQPAALACCLVVIFAFEHFNHGVATLLAFAATGGTGYAILRRIPLSIACTVGILAGLAIARLS
jgi:Cu/Ag efflux pump CusA